MCVFDRPFKGEGVNYKQFFLKILIFTCMYVCESEQVNSMRLYACMYVHLYVGGVDGYYSSLVLIRSTVLSFHFRYVDGQTHWQTCVNESKMEASDQPGRRSDNLCHLCFCFNFFLSSLRLYSHRRRSGFRHVSFTCLFLCTHFLQNFFMYKMSEYMRVFFPVSAERFMVWGYAGCWLVASSWPIGCLNESPVFFLAAAVFFLFLQMPLFRCPSVLWGPCEFFISSNITWKLSMVWTSNELESFQNIWGSMIPMEGDLKQRRRHFFFLMQTSKHQFILFLKYCRLKCPVCTTLTESSIQTWSRLLDSSIWRWLRNVRLKLFFCFFFCWYSMYNKCLLHHWRPCLFFDVRLGFKCIVRCGHCTTPFQHVSSLWSNLRQFRRLVVISVAHWGRNLRIAERSFCIHLRVR